MGVLKADEFMTAERRERVQIAEAVEERNRNRLDTCHREGGYFLSSAGVPQDSEGRTIPEAEWKDEDLLRIRGQAALDARHGVVAADQVEPADVPPVAPTKADGADVVEGSGSENRTAQRAQMRAGRGR